MRFEADAESRLLVQRPDGWYWLADEGRGEVGPFATAAECLADLRAGQDTEDRAAALREAEEEIGVADWIDPETHAPAESHAPHIEDV